MERTGVTMDVVGCLGCDLTAGRRDLPGGRIHETQYWVVEHCIGPLPVGTLIVKPLRHCEQFWKLNPDEVAELGPLLRRVTATTHALLAPDQVYVCLWSHAGWIPGHLHFVLQPSWNLSSAAHQRPGPFLQAELFEAGVSPRRADVEGFAESARAYLSRKS